jgi:HlyD family secretion protein
MKRVIRIVLGLVVVAAVAAGGYWFYMSRFAPAAVAPTSFTQIVEVTEGNLSDSLSVVGELDSIQSQDLQFTELQEAADLLSLDVQPGTTVKAGETLATIDPTPFEQALKQAKTDLEAAEKTLADLQTPATSLQLAQADLAVAKADYQVQKAKQDLADLQQPDLTELQATLQEAQDKLARLDFDKQLGERDELAKTERDLGYTIDWYQRRIAELKNQDKKNAEEMAEYEERQVELVELWAEMNRVQSQRALANVSLETEASTYQAEIADAQEALNDAGAGGGELELAKAQLAIREAEVALTQARDDRTTLDTGADAGDLAAARADVEKKRLAVQDAEAALAGTELKAPFDGTILDIDARAGDKITASTVIMTIANLTEMQVFASVDETTIRRVQEGQEAQISFDAFPGQTFKGKVLSVPLQGTLQNDVMVYQVPLR